MQILLLFFCDEDFLDSLFLILNKEFYVGSVP